MVPKTCSIEGCDTKAQRRGMCDKHYRRWKKHGNPQHHGGRGPAASNDARFWSKVDKGAPAGCWEWTAALHQHGYGIFSLRVDKHNWKTVRAHRYAWEKLRGPVPPGMQLDHVCHNRKCLNPDHLRVVTNQQNHENYRGTHSNNTTGYRGVYRHAETGKFYAQVGRKNLGAFDTAEEAAAVAKAYRMQVMTHNDMDRRT